MNSTAPPATRELPTPDRPPIQLKGRGRELRMSIAPRCDPAEAEASLRSQLAGRGGAFFGDAQVLLEFGGRLDLALAQRLAGVLDEAGIRVIGIVTPEARAPRPEPGVDRLAPDLHLEGARVVTGNLRGGQRISHVGSVVVLGDVNPGAEVLAGEHVIVWGRLRGVVEAGLARDPEAVDDIRVCALDLSPTQLRIGDAIARAPVEPDRVPTPEAARSVAGSIVVDTWR